MGKVSTLIRAPRMLVEFADDLFSQFETAWAAAPRECAKVVGGRRFRIRSALEARIASAEKAIADHPALARDEGETRLLIAVAARDRMPIWGMPEFSDLLTEAATAGSRYDVHHFLHLRFWQFYDRIERRGIQLLSSPDGVPPWDSGSPLRNLMKWDLSSATCGLVHAGTLATGSKGMMFFGPSGSGKSGTVLAGIASGLDSVGDDYVLARLGTQGLVVAEPMFRTLKSDPQGIDRTGLSQLPLAAQPLNWQGKHEFTFCDLANRPQPGRIAISALCLPVVAHEARSRFEPMTAKDAFLALAPSGIAQVPGSRAANFAFCAALTRRLPAFRLHLSADPAEIADTIRSFLTQDGQPAC